MVNDANRIDGSNLDKHPFSKDGKVEVYSKAGTFLAAMAEIGGVIVTRDAGERRFQAGDFIVTDNPPSHAWPVNEQVFKATFHKVSEPPIGALPNVPVSAVPALARRTAQKTKTQQRAAQKRASAPKTRPEGRKMAAPRSKDEPGVPGREMTDIVKPKVADSESLGTLG